MLIITADDYGKTRRATDNIQKCLSRKRITSASAMVFMEDSERAAALAYGTNLEVGLHLNFTLPFNAAHAPLKLRERHNLVLSYLGKQRLSQVIYNPFLTAPFNYVFLSQQEEFMRLYNRFPDYYNGHHHMHLCANVLASKMLPNGARVRNTFTFDPGEKDIVNRLYRFILDICVKKRFISTDCFFSIAPLQNYQRLRTIISRAVNETVEIEVHPEDNEETDFLISDRYLNLLNSTTIGCFRNLKKNSREAERQRP